MTAVLIISRGQRHMISQMDTFPDMVSSMLQNTQRPEATLNIERATVSHLVENRVQSMDEDEDGSYARDHTEMQTFNSSNLNALQKSSMVAIDQWRLLRSRSHRVKGGSMTHNFMLSINQT